MIALAVYRWMQEEKSRTDTLVAFISICISVISILFLQMGTLLCEVNGLFTFNKKEANDGGETNGEVGEPDHEVGGVELTSALPRTPETTNDATASASV